MYIKMDTDIMSKKTDDIKSSLDSFLNYDENMWKIVDGMNSFWQGKDYDYFSSEMLDFYKQLKRLYRSVESYNNYVKGYVRVAMAIDKYYANKNVSLK